MRARLGPSKARHGQQLMVPNSSSWGALLLLACLVLLLSSAAAQDPVAPTEPTAGSVPAPADTSPNIPSSAGNSNTSNSPPPLEAAPDNLTPKTKESVQMAQQQQQQDNSSDTGPAVDATQGVQEVYNLASVRGCSSVAGSPFLSPGLDNTCRQDGVLGRRETVAWTFSLPPVANNTRPYRVVIMLRTIDGQANLGLSIPGVGRGPEGLVPNVVGTTVYNTEVTSEQFIAVPWRFINASQGGSYVLTLGGASGRVVYSLKVSTPYADTRLAEPDTESMQELMNACCPESTQPDSIFCKVLPVALDPGHSDSDDLCNMPPMMCNSEGRLTQLAAASVGMVCPNGLPADLSGLSALQTLDLAFNNLNSTTDRLAQVMSSLPALENVFLRYTDTRGRLNCSMLDAAANLERLSLSGNTDLVGEIPGCFLQAPALEELYLSVTSLSGQLPDTATRNSSLKAFFAIGLFDQQRRDPTNPGFTGPVPRSLLTSNALQYLDLSNNDLTGALPSLPPTLKLLNMSGNTLDGVFPAALPAGIEVLGLSMNKLTGSLPSDLSGYAEMDLLDVSGNQLSGSFPKALPPNLLVLDVSQNKEMTGPLPSPLPQSMVFLGATGASLTGDLPDLPQESSIVRVLLGANKLEGPIPLSYMNGTARMLSYLDLSNNQLTGQIDPTAAPPAGRRRLFSMGLRRLRRMLLQGPSVTPVPTNQTSEPDNRPQQVAPTQLTPEQRQQMQRQQGAQQSPDQQQQPTGSWASQPRLSYLDLGFNQLTGPVPANLGKASSLLYLSLNNNKLSGSLDQYAAALAANNVTSRLLGLDLANNQLTGPIPAGLQKAGMLNPDLRASSARGRPAARVLSLANNSFSGELPSFLVTQPPVVEEACAENGCIVRVLINGPDSNVQCPANLSLTVQQAAYVDRADYECVNSAGQKVMLTGAPDQSADPTAASPSRAASGNTPQSYKDSVGSIYVPYPESSGGSSAAKLNGGQIAGIVIGAVAGSVLIASLIAAAAIRYKKHRAGWRKDELPDHPSLDAAFGVSPMPSGAVPTHTAAAAEAGMGHNGLPLQYAHSPYSVRAAGSAPGAIEMQNSGERNGHI